MFAKLKGGNAICLEEYNGLNAGAIVPKSNARWADVEQWIEDNGPMPDYDYPPEPEPVKTRFTSLEYLDRFTTVEEDGILDAMAEDKQVRKFYDRLLAATYIDVEDARTAQGLDLLISKGLLASSRKDELLAPESM